MTITQTNFTSQTGTVSLFELRNSKGTSVKITNAGACITSIVTADKNGQMDEITLGFDDPSFYLSKEYLSNCPYLGTTAGRFANRIAHGRFSIGQKEYTLAVNNGNHHLHGGPTGYHARLWDAELSNDGGNQKLVLSLKSPHLDEGYPGEVLARVSFFLTNDDELILYYHATASEATPINLTNHTYFNLNGLKRDILEQEVMIFANGYTEKQDDIPTGTIVPVKDTPYDFLTFHKIGERLSQLPQDAYDHNFVLNLEEGNLTRAAIARDPESGRTLEVYTTLPGMQFYTGYHLDGSYERGGRRFERFGGFCMETQYFPDSPNKAHFPDCIATPEKPFDHTTVFKFGIEK